MRQVFSLSTQHKRIIELLFGLIALCITVGPINIARGDQEGGPVPAPRRVLDFDGDGRTDYAVVRNEGGTFNWYLLRSTLGFAAQPWGVTGDQMIPGDYDGDGKWDIAVWRAGSPAVFHILRSIDGTLQSIAFGQSGDDPRITQDFDGDGKADPAVTRLVGGTLQWYIQRSALGFIGVSFGTTSDVGIRGDFDGDSKADIAVYRNTGGSPSNTFFVLRSSDGVLQSATFGIFSTDFILPADFDGDGRTDYAVWRGFGATSDGTWYWQQSSDGAFRSFNFGIGNFDRPVVGDYDNDGKSDQAVWRPGQFATFYVNRSMLGFVGFQFGTTIDLVPAHTLQAR